MKKTLLSSAVLIAFMACQAPEARVVELEDTGAGLPTSILLDSDGNPVLGPDNMPIQVDANGVPLIAAPQKTGAIEDDPNRIVLADETQEEQKRSREAYAAQLTAIAAQRDEITAVEVPEATTISATAYARTTTNRLGVKNYNRSGKRGSCNYPSPLDAQRKFLELGGPDADPRGLDPDGDGFACDFNPELYRF